MKETLAAEERLALIYRVLNHTQYKGAPANVKKLGMDIAFHVSCTGAIDLKWLELVNKELPTDLSYFIGLVNYRTNN